VNYTISRVGSLLKQRHRRWKNTRLWIMHFCKSSWLMKYMIPRHICASRFYSSLIFKFFCFHEQNGTPGGTRFSSHLWCTPMVIKYLSYDDSVILTLHWPMLATGLWDWHACCYKEIAPHVLYCDKNEVDAHNLHDEKFKYKDSCHEFSSIIMHARRLKKRHA
jgi:hypothetical protein